MSDAMEFFKKSEALFQFYQEGKYADALAVAEKLAVEYPEQDARTAFWLICLQNMTGQSEKALLTFKDALARGVWWAEFRMRGDSDLDSLQGNTEFERLVKLSEEMRLQADASAKPDLFVYQPEGKGPFPLLISLSPRGGSPELDFRNWQSAIKLGWMLALPQSSQLASPLSFVWDDREKALNEILVHVETLVREYPIDRNRIVVAGFSQGAARAIELVMSQKFKARGFIAVVPGTLDSAELEGWATSPYGDDAGAGRGVLISGGRDPRYEMFIQIREIFAKHNLPLMFENFPELAHQIPNDFEPMLERSLNFLCNPEKEYE
jgi:predicted esterase